MMISAPCPLSLQYLALLSSELASFPGRLSAREAKAPLRSSKFTWIPGAHEVRNRESPSFIEFILIFPTPKILSGPARTSGSITVPRLIGQPELSGYQRVGEKRFISTEERRKTSEKGLPPQRLHIYRNIYGLLTACMVLKILGNLQCKLKVLVLRDFKDPRYDGI